MNNKVAKALKTLNDLILNQGWEFPEAFDLAGTRLGSKDLSALRIAYDQQD
jgi:hypothetical protein